MKTNHLLSISFTKLFLFSFLFFAQLYSLNAQIDIGPRWTYTHDGTQALIVSVSCMAKDQDKNLYVAGWFSGTVDLNPGPGVYNFTAKGFNDMYLQKFDANDSLLWVKQFKSRNGIRPRGMQLDSAGNIYICGEFSDSADFNPGPGTHNVTAAFGGSDAFLLKLKNNGSFKWVNTFGDFWSDDAFDLDIDKYGNPYIVGNIKGSIDFGYPAGTPNYVAANQAAYIAKYAPNGNLHWAEVFEGTGSLDGWSVALDTLGNIFASGTFNSTVDFNNDTTQTATVTSNGGTDVFLLKLDTAGKYLWAHNFGGTTNNVTGPRIVVDDTGHVYTSIFFAGYVDFNPGTGTAYLWSTGASDEAFLKIKANGDFGWVKQISGQSDKLVREITMDEFGNFWLVGRFWGTADFNPDPTKTENRTSKGFNDGFLLKLQPNGDFDLVKTLGGPNRESIKRVITDSTSVYIFGYHSDNADLNPNNATEIYQATGYHDAFMQKYGPCSVQYDTIFAQTCATFTAPDGQVLDTTTQYTFYKTTPLGCDSSITVNYTRLNSFSSYAIATCDSFVAPDSTVFYASTQLTSIISNAAGCDSIISIDLTINNSDTALAIFVCDSFVSPSGNVYKTNGVYTDTLQSYIGCDSVVTYNLSVNHTSYNTINLTGCDSIIAPDGMIYKTSGTYQATIPNSTGCDSIIQLNATILQSYSDTITPAVCYAYTAPDSAVYTASGTYAATFTNQAGCDSTIVINLTILDSNASTHTVYACKKFVAPDGQEITNSGTYNFTLTNAQGCDSNITVHLNIIQPDTAISYANGQLEASSLSASYQWLNCDLGYAKIPGQTSSTFSPFANGSYAVQVENDGCLDTSACFLVEDIGIGTNQIADISFSPNPVVDWLEILQQNNETLQVEIFDARGISVYKNTVNYKKNKIDLSALASGVYTIQFKRKQAQTRQSLVKLR